MMGMSADVCSLHDQGKDIVIYRTIFPEQLRSRVRGMTERDGDVYSVLIDGSQPDAVQQHTLGHELAHIFLNHFDENRTGKAAEDEADAAAGYYYSKYIDDSK